MKSLPVGIDDFEKVRSGNYYYVDKTELIRDIISQKAEVTLFTRPRRFGKTLNMSMLKNFFEIGTDPALFDGLAISEEKEISFLTHYGIKTVLCSRRESGICCLILSVIMITRKAFIMRFWWVFYRMISIKWNQTTRTVLEDQISW